MPTEIPMKQASLLVVEDDDIDAKGIERAFKKLKVANPIYRVKDGLEALALLRGEAGLTALEKPYIILLDLNMPRMSGIEFLEAIRHDSTLYDTIVFVLTTSKADQDRTAAYKNNVAGYIVKSDVQHGFYNVLDLIDNYWKIVELPT